MQKKTFDNEKLWKMVLSGSPLVKTFALVILDDKMNGKITKLAKKLMESGK